MRRLLPLRHTFDDVAGELVRGLDSGDILLRAGESELKAAEVKKSVWPLRIEPLGALASIPLAIAIPIDCARSVSTMPSSEYRFKVMIVGAASHANQKYRCL